MLTRLFEAWTGFIPSVLRSPERLLHVTNLVAHLSPRTLETLPAKYPDLSQFVSANLAPILGLGVDIEPARLALLKIEIADLASIGGFAGTARFLFEQGLYNLTPGNLEFIFQTVLGLDETELLRTQNYTTVLKTANSALLARIDRNFEEYLEGVLLKLDTNSQESVAAILAVISREKIELGTLSSFLAKQASLLPSLEGVPTGLHPVVFQLAKIEASWANCLAFIGSEHFDAESLTAYLNTRPALAALSTHPIPDGNDARGLRKFLIEADGLQDDVYQAYIKLLPKQFQKFPDNLEASKLQILVEERKITFSAENVNILASDRDLQVLFVAKNIDLYLAEQDEFSMDEEFSEELLGSNIDDNHKLSIIQSMDLATLASEPSRARAVGEVLVRTGVGELTLDGAAARTIVLNSSPIGAQISLLNMLNSLFDDSAIRDILRRLPAPFSEITTGYHTPVLEMNEANDQLAKWLEAREIISSSSKGFFGDTIRINLFRREW
ncbi:hypothetical protein [Phenylobacterium soli]|uniref:Uncharacterized protein n=1 Tax=Phenylobacterium soli TaxID=2170551 RepID=A0A328ALM4_9CAUL|nr:hypothetical protein [Phenylobacterium soli]RAK55499.1 hypothetical protein DJ017_13740 [Phenylobacterium soli]